MKNKGYITIEELIEHLQGKKEETPKITQPVKEHFVEDKPNFEHKVEYKPESIKEPAVSAPVKPIELSKLPDFDIKSQLNNATFLLYLGSGLVLFAVFIFVAFNWQSFTPITKSIIVLLLTLSFYLAGYITHNYPKLKQASGTFFFIGSICLGLTGIGIWNFNEVAFRVRGIDFSTYWLLYSVILVSVYIASYLKQKTRSYLYMTLATLYSIITSIAFTITNDDKFRIVVIALLNLGVFSLKTYTLEMDRMISIASRSINYVLDVFIYFIIASMLAEITTVENQLIALFALLIPSIFNLISYIKLKNIIDLQMLIITSPIKLLMVCWIFGLNLGESGLIFAIYLIISSLMRENVKVPGLYNTFEAMNWVVGIFLTVSLVSADGFFASTQLINIALILITGNFTIPYLIKNKAREFAIGVNFLIPVIYKIYLNQLDTDFIWNFPGEELHMLSIIILILANTLNIYFKVKHSGSGMKYGFVGFVIINSMITLLLGSILTLEKFFLTLLVLSVTGFIFKSIYNQDNKVEKFLSLMGNGFSILFNVIAIIAALSTSNDVYTTKTALIATLAVGALPILNLVQIFEGKIKEESYVTIAMIPFHILTFCIVNKLSFENMIIIFTLYSIIKVLASEYYLKKEYFKLHILSQIIFWTMLVFTTFFTTTAVISEFDFTVSKLVVVFVCIANLISFNLPAIIYKRYEILTITCNYLIFTAFRLLGLVFPAENTIAYLTTAVVLHIGGLAAHFWFNSKEERKNITFIPFTIISGLTIILTIFGTTNLYMMTGFGVITLTSMIIANFHRKDELKYISVISLFFASNFAIGYIYQLAGGNKYLTDAFLNTLIIIPGIIYMLNFEINYFENKVLKSNILVIIVFSVYAAIITVDYYRILILIVLLGYCVYLMIKHKWKFASILVFGITQLIHLQLASIGTYSYDRIFLGISAISFLFTLPTLFTKKYNSMLVVLGAISLCVITMLSIPYALNNPTNTFMLAGSFACSGLVIADRYNKWFGNIAGLAMLGVLWNLSMQYNIDRQFMIFALFLFLIYLSVRYYKFNDSKAAFLFEFTAYIIQSTSLLIDSINGVDSERIFMGMLLIVFASVIAILGFNRKNNILFVTGIAFLILELIIRLYVVIVSLDWWVYLLVIGVLMIGGAIYIFMKAGDKTIKN
jgi:hypothetical protein